MRNVAGKSCKKKSKYTFYVRWLLFSWKSCRLWDNVKSIVERCRSQMTIWRMRIACWIPKATNTHTLRLCNTHCLSTATTVARTRLNVTLKYTACLVADDLLWPRMARTEMIRKVCNTLAGRWEIIQMFSAHKIIFKTYETSQWKWGSLFIPHF